MPACIKRESIGHTHRFPLETCGNDIILARGVNGYNLRGADLSEANLSQANLSRTDLIEANLFEVNLRKADLRGAYLNGADLSGADLSRANFNEAIVSRPVFGNVGLCDVKGLDTVNHQGPSYIDLHTGRRSNGKIPDVFLRRAGVDEIFITYMSSLTGKDIEFCPCFISYSHKDEAFAQRLYTDLESKGLRCWHAPEDRKIGDKIGYTIDRSIRIHDKLLLILSEYSVPSEWVEYEVEHALTLKCKRKEPVLFPVRLDGAVMESKTGWATSIKRGRHIGNFTRWKDHNAYRKSFERLLRDLKARDNQ